MTIRILIIIFLSLIFSQVLLCQTNVITGTVVSYETKEPLPFFSIELKGKKDYVAITDNEGKFVLKNISRSKNDYLKISFIGYKTLKFINIPNYKDTINLDSISIPAYFQRKGASIVVITCRKGGTPRPQNSIINKTICFFINWHDRIKEKKDVRQKNKKIIQDYRYIYENNKYKISYKNNTINLRKPIKHK